MTSRPWRDDVRLSDDDITDWLVRELGGEPGDAGVEVELVVRVVENEEGKP